MKIPTILKRGVSDVASIFDAFGIGIYCVDLDGRFTYVNPAGQTLLGWCAEELLGRRAHDIIHHSRPDGSSYAREECPIHHALRFDTAAQELDDLFWRNDGSPLEVAYTIAPLHADDERVGAIVVFVDDRQRRRDAELLRRQAAQQAALAELGLMALGGGSLQTLLERVTGLVAETLDVELTDALELDPDADCLRLRAAVGLRPGLVGTVTVPTGRGSRSGFAVARDEPVVVEDLRTETRFRPPPFLLEHGVISGLTIVIHGGDHRRGVAPWGVLGAHTRSLRAFTEEDINFMHTVANTLGLAIERKRVERELRERNRKITELAEQVSKLADDRRRLMADALDAEDRTREQISQLLHDEVLQCLLAARQDLAKLGSGDAARNGLAVQAREAVAAAIRELRTAVVALHPVALERGGLAPALKAITDLHAGRSGFEVTLDVGPRTSGVHDQLIISLVQELLNNVAQHAEASRVSITLGRTHRGIVFEVADDGLGMTLPTSPRALGQGHVGLASIALRVESLGGSLQLTSSPGQGTSVRSVIPIATARRVGTASDGRQLAD